MLRMLKIYTTQRGIWLCLVLLALLFEGIAILFQHALHLPPCVMCIYERVALLGILFAGLFALIAPQYIFFRLFGLLMGFVGSIKGLLLSLKHLDYQLNPSPWNQCELFVRFPNYLPLDKWFPAFFRPTGLCQDVLWSFLGLSMVQWIVVMFALFAIIFLLLIISQFVRLFPNRLLFTENKG